MFPLSICWTGLARCTIWANLHIELLLTLEFPHTNWGLKYFGVIGLEAFFSLNLSTLLSLLVFIPLRFNIINACLALSFYGRGLMYHFIFKNNPMLYVLQLLFYCGSYPSQLLFHSSIFQ
jgi:hypothetical protein